MKNSRAKTFFIVILSLTLLSHFNVGAQVVPNTSTNQNAIFPKGDKAPAENFTGTVWVRLLVPNDSTFHCVMGNVVFEPGARTNWHKHPAGQILLVTDGRGYY